MPSIGPAPVAPGTRRNGVVVPSDEHVEALAGVFEVATRDIRSVVVTQYSDFALVHGAIAVTRTNAIHLRGSAQRFFATPLLALHEYYHVLRQWNTGDLTVRRYIGEWIRQGCCYERIKYEVDANRFAARNVQKWLRFVTGENHDVHYGNRQAVF